LRPQTTCAAGGKPGIREITPIAPDFADRTELWRLATYLAVITIDGRKPFGRQYLARLADAIRLYR
jgi:hypothetical protein